MIDLNFGGALKVAAFDLSLTQTGYAISEGGDRRVGTIRTDLRGMERLEHIRARVLELAAGADLVVIEGYSYASANQAHQLGELGGVIRFAFHQERIEYAEIAPALLKKYLAGKGNAGKEEMLVAAVRRLGYQGHNNNEADALGLLHAAMESQGCAWAELPAAQRKAIEAVKWPMLAVAR